MYDLKSMLGKVVTIRTNKGEEIIALMSGLNDEKTIVTVNNPQIVFYMNDQVLTLPFALTANTETVHLQLSNILTIMPSLTESANFYLAELKEKEPQEVEVEETDA